MDSLKFLPTPAASSFSRMTPTASSRDRIHIDHNRKAKEKMRRAPMLELIHGANHLFGEPGKLEQVALISFLWFQHNLALP